MALSNDRTLWGWGQDQYGQVGNGIGGDSKIPSQIPGVWRAVSAGAFHTMAIANDGTLWGWGEGSYGKIGDGTTSNRSAPVLVEGTTSWRMVAAGADFSVGLKNDGSLWVWGKGYQTYPTQLTSITEWNSVSLSGSHTLLIRKDGSLWAWGNNSSGKLGDGTTTSRPEPVQIQPGTTWKAVAAGGSHSLGVRSDGTLWAWGYNTYSALGTDSPYHHSTPVQVGNDSDWSRVFAYSQSIGIKTDGSLWTWGYNGYGQLCNGTTSTGRVPAQIGSYNDWVDADGGISHTIALRSNGTVYVCGGNGSGQLGIGTSDPYSHTSLTELPAPNLGTTITTPPSSNAYSAFSVHSTRAPRAEDISAAGSANYDNEFRSVKEQDLLDDPDVNKSMLVISHALYPVQYYTQSNANSYGWITPRNGTADPGDKQPLILIHGWQGDTGIHSDPLALNREENLGETYWNNFIQFFINSPALSSRYRLYVYHYPSYKHVTFNARMLKQLIEKTPYISRWLGDGKKISILAHSMGGLVARSLIEEHLDESSESSRLNVTASNGTPHALSGTQVLERLIALATPHHGSPAAVYWWLMTDPAVKGQSLALFKKDLFTPGSQDLFWDNYDGVLAWGEGHRETNLIADTSIPSELEYNNSGRLNVNMLFDLSFRLKLSEKDSRATSRNYTATINGNNTFIYRFPNPWLSLLNTKLKHNLDSPIGNSYRNKYIFFGGYNDADNGSSDNRLHDLFEDWFVDGTVYSMGYVNDYAVPLTSAFLDFSKESTVGDNEFNPKLFTTQIGSDGKAALFDTFIYDNDPTSGKVVLRDYWNGVSVVVFKDYLHDRLLNGAYKSNPPDLLGYSGDALGGFRSMTDAELYHLQSDIDQQAFLADVQDPLLQGKAKLRYEPLFNLAAGALLSSPPQCGAASGNASTEAPTANLCSSGTPSVVTGTGPWQWTCSSPYSQEPEACSAPVMTFSITTSSSPDGAVLPSFIQAQYGSSQVFQIMPTPGFGLDQIYGCGGELSGNLYRTALINLGCCITAVFAPATVRVEGTGNSREYARIQTAFDSIGNAETVKLLSNFTYSEIVTVHKPVNAILSGGYGTDFVRRSDNSWLTGTLILSQGMLTVDGLTIR